MIHVLDFMHTRIVSNEAARSYLWVVIILLALVQMRTKICLLHIYVDPFIHQYHIQLSG